MFHKPPRSTPGALINTPLQRGVTCWQDLRNRFNGFSRAMKTVETGSDALRTPNTLLKQGVNEKWPPWSIRRYEISGPKRWPPRSHSRFPKSVFENSSGRLFLILFLILFLVLFLDF